MRAAVDVVQQRPLLLRVEVGRIDHPHLHRVAAVRPGRGIRARAQLHAVACTPSLKRVDAPLACAAARPEHLRRRAHVVAHEGDRVAGHVEIARPCRRARRRSALRAPSGRAPQVLARRVLGRRTCSARPNRASHASGACTLRSQSRAPPPASPLRAVDEREPAACAMGSCASVLRDERDPAAVGRIARRLVLRARVAVSVRNAPLRRSSSTSWYVVVEALLLRPGRRRTTISRPSGEMS